VKGLEMRSLLLHLLRHPSAVGLVVGAAWRIRRDAWWRRAPFLPVPGRDYWAFRLVTANGSSSVATGVREIIEYATWSRQQRTTR
jgi:hypothetical protein